MSSLVVNSLANANVYINGASLLGRAAEVSIPQPKRMMTDYRGLGMVGRIEIPVGWDKLESTIKWSSFDQVTLLQLATSNSIVICSVMADLQTNTAAGEVFEQPVIYNFSGYVSDMGKIDFKAQELVEYTTTFSIYHVDLTVGGVPVYLYDSFANIYTVGGVDQLALYRANIGAM